MSQTRRQPNGREVKLRVFRGMGNDPSTHRYDTFTVPHQDGMVVLNAIHYIQSHFDSSLSARWNCKAGQVRVLLSRDQRSPTADVQDARRQVRGRDHRRADEGLPAGAGPRHRRLGELGRGEDDTAVHPQSRARRSPGNSTRRTSSAPERCGSASSASSARTSATSSGSTRRTTSDRGGS